MKNAAAVLLLSMVAHGLAAQGTPAAAVPPNSINCLNTGQELPQLPEAKSQNGILRATLGTTAVQVRMTTGAFGGAPTPPTAPMGSPCYAQWVREYRLGPTPASATSSTTLSEPMPGPVFRANVGDLVELTFLNQIDRNKFPNSDAGCDKTSTYPSTPPVQPGDTPDSYPDCFAMSTTTNMHYHGTHTNPGSTGDNVFLEIKPSPRSNDAARVPVVTSDSVRAAFGDFFTRCEAMLAPNDVPKQWPRFWGDLPQSTRDLLSGLLQQYAPDLWAQDEEMIRQGAWPQYYIGAYPYCFRLPEYTASAWPPPTPGVSSTHTPGAGSAEHDEAAAPQRPLLMGQAPGTHWYHAHKHGSTTVNVMNGMTGVFIVEDPSPTGYDGFIANAYKAYPGFKQKVLVVNQLGTTPSLTRGGGGGPGPHFSVNGRLQPKITMAGGEVQLWRISNESSRGGMYVVKPTNGLKWKQLAQDGVQFDAWNYENDNDTKPLLLAAGNRADLLVKAPMLPAGGAPASLAFAVMNTVDPTDIPPYASAATESLVTVQVNANGADMPFMPGAPPMPPFLADIADSEVKGTKTLTFASSAFGGKPIANHPAQHTIDGKKFDGEIGASVRLNKVEEWKIVNETYIPNQISHPFHIHINPFQISETFDPSATSAITDGAGQVTMTKGSNVVTGSGFTGNVQVGDFLWIAGQAPATVFAVTDTSLTLSITPGANGSAAYKVAVPLYTIAKPARTGQCYIDPNDSKSWKPCGPTEPAAHRLWWDVFPIPSGNIFYADAGATQVKIPGYFKMRSRFVDYAGYYVLHCHILAHEDRGMMTVVEVSPLQPPYSHH